VLMNSIASQGWPKSSKYTATNLYIISILLNTNSAVNLTVTLHKKPQ
jgi:hypothetical protein